MEIQELLDEGIQENQRLEYKKYSFKDGKFNSLEQKQRSALLKEICAFANAQGGTILLGIVEDEKHNPTDISDTGVTKENFEEWEQSFRMFCKTKLRPVLHGIECNRVDYEGINLIHIEVPKSILKPHAFYDGNRDEFYIRYGNICNHMSYDDLKRSFIELESIQSKISSFRDNRLAMILNDEVIDGLLDDTVLVVHVIPHWSMGLSNYVNLDKVKDDQLFDVFSPSSRGNRRGKVSFNTDGMIVTYGYGESPVMSYSQLFHNGAIESVEIRMMNNSINQETRKFIYEWDKMEQLLYQNLTDFCNILERGGIPKPYSIFVSILNAKGKQARMNEWGELSRVLTRDIIKAIPAYISEDSSFDEALVPLFDSLAHSFGVEKSLYFSSKDHLRS